MLLSGGRRRGQGFLSRLAAGRGRYRGLGKQIVAAAIDTATEKLHADKITIEAQTYVKKMYEDFGFRQTSEEFLEDGIPHVQMQLDLTK